MLHIRKTRYMLRQHKMCSRFQTKTLVLSSNLKAQQKSHKAFRFFFLFHNPNVELFMLSSNNNLCFVSYKHKSRAKLNTVKVKWNNSQDEKPLRSKINGWGENLFFLFNFYEKKGLTCIPGFVKCRYSSDRSYYTACKPSSTVKCTVFTALRCTF